MTEKTEAPKSGYLCVHDVGGPRPEFYRIQGRNGCIRDIVLAFLEVKKTKEDMF